MNSSNTRKRARLPRSALVNLAVLLAACAGTPTRFHTLDPVAPAAAPATASIAPPVRLDSVTLPSELDRLAIVRRSGPGRLDVADTDRWAGPLDAIARQALAADLEARLPPGTLVRPGDPDPPTNLRSLDVEIERFEGDLGGTVALVAHWTMRDPGKSAETRLRRDERIEIPGVSSDVDATVTGMGRALAALADRIAAALRDR
jgi:uncharacterized protein